MHERLIKRQNEIAAAIHPKGVLEVYKGNEALSKKAIKELRLVEKIMRELGLADANHELTAVEHTRALAIIHQFLQKKSGETEENIAGVKNLIQILTTGKIVLSKNLGIQNIMFTSEYIRNLWQKQLEVDIEYDKNLIIDWAEKDDPHLILKHPDV